MDPQGTYLLIKMLGALCLVLGILLALNYGVRRWGRGIGGNALSGGRIRVLATKEILPKKYVSIVEVDGRELVLGVSESGINLLERGQGPQFTCQGQGSQSGKEDSI